MVSGHLLLELRHGILQQYEYDAFSTKDTVVRGVDSFVFNQDLQEVQPSLGPPVAVSGLRLVNGRASYGFGLTTYAIGFPIHIDWAWRTMFNRTWEDVVFAQEGGSDEFRRVRFSVWIGHDF